ncbi:unnamed protein product [Adineta steineri]|uniref:Uncharacterized protein n=1 Tax=Adineta steineri TaxID=433720 RepID=A0A813N759_9BILA|nr:unnamed protein product [Adineta steineri]CAF0724625.1 unnamed protein product [Adineta steineri]CAF0734095.1 unnamed protein product [Adineta steineri]CAF0734247.1 unnamed protein product [Adineta steineri]CAF3476928.1 unnamed protein product [Adineta steineri]
MTTEDIDATSVEEFDPYRATGLWHILATNLNMWKDKLTPTITYSIHDQLPDGRVRLNDLVEYYSKRPCVGYRPTSLEGIDTQLPSKASRYQWRGDGILKLFTSEFGFVFVDNETTSDRPYQWVAIICSSTLFSSGGINLMTRTRQPPTHVLNDFVRFCHDHPILKSKSVNMFYTRDKASDEVYYIRDLQTD